MNAISQMKPNKAPGPDGFPAEFYKKCWHIIKNDLMPMFHDIFNGHLELCHLNFGVIMLLPKKRSGSYRTLQANLSSECEFQNFHESGY